MPTELLNALLPVAERLISLAFADPELRAELRRLAQAILDATEPPDGLAGNVEEAVDDSMAAMGNLLSIVSEEGLTVAEPPNTPVPADSIAGSTVLPKLSLGQGSASSEASPITLPARGAVSVDADLSLIVARCRLKGEGARWAAARHRLIKQGAAFATDIEPGDREIIVRAKAVPDCFLWMCRPDSPALTDMRLYEEVAGCFHAVADALAVLKQLHDEPDLNQAEFESSLDLLAEAQSALRIAIGKIDGPTDSDQMQVYKWLRATATENQIFIHRHMRIDDPADPSQWTDLSCRIEAVDARLQEARKQVKGRKRLLGKVRHKVSLLGSDPQGAVEHWRLLAAAADELVSGGLPPSNRELRELLVPVIDTMPELAEVPQGFQLVLREIDRFLSTCPPLKTAPATQRSADVQEVARLLTGRSMVLIGGDRRAEACQSLKDAFGLKELFWIETREHESIESFESYVAKGEVAVVALAIRWSSHSYGDVKGFCDRHGKPLVRLPAGYNPNQVAAQIMTQCSGRLKGE